MLEMNELFPWGRSGSLRLQFLSVEVFSLSRNYAAGASMIWNPRLAALRLR
jgi:hypothetical protein